MSKECLECGETFIGRSDAKFCSPQCRTAHHNKQNPELRKRISGINKILARNRKILEGLNPEGKVKLHRDKLVAKGFDFNYFTNIYTTKTGTVYHYCYEQGYLELDGGFFLLVVND